MSAITLACPDGLNVFVDEADRNPERTLSNMQGELSEEGAPAGRQEVRLKLGGASRRAVRLGSKASPYSWLTVTLSGSNGSSRFLGCGPTPAHEPRCVRILDRLVGSGLPERFAAKVRQPSELAVAGRTLRLPAGCEVSRLSSNHGGVSCADGTYLGWAVGERDVADAVHESQVKVLSAGLTEGIWESGVPCSAFGKPGACRRGTGGGAMTGTEVVIGRWTIGDSALVAFSIVKGRHIPEPCSQVMTVEGRAAR